MNQTDKKPNALFIHNAAVGDFIIACRLIEFCNERLEQFRWSYLGKTSHGKLAKALGLIADFDNFEVAGWHQLFAPDCRIADQIKKVMPRFDLIINAVTGPNTIFAQNIKTLCPAGRIFHVDPKMPPDFKGHIFKYLASSLRIGPVNELPQTAFPVDPKLLQEIKPVSPDQPLIIFHPGASTPKKRWPIVNFISLAKKVKEKENQAIILLGQVELEQFKKEEINLLRSAGKLFINYPLEKLAAILTQAKQYIGNDNGISHLSAAVGTDTVVVFMQKNFQHWRPLGPKVQIMKSDSIS